MFAFARRCKVLNWHWCGSASFPCWGDSTLELCPLGHRRVHPPGEIHPGWGRLCGFTFYSISVDWSEGQYLSQQKCSEPSRTPSGLRGHAFRLAGPSLHAQLVAFVLRLCDTAMLIFDFNVVHQSLEWPPSSVLLHRGPQKLSFM